jgi:indoleamine 2,3-dioxygenase
VGRSRAKHLEYAARYIFEQAETSPVNPTTVGTGSTPFMPYLKSHRDETWAHLVR